jgi:hypothetical protein
MESSASDNPLASGNRRLVTLVFKVKVTKYSGTGWPGAVGVPPKQFRIRSFTNSAMPEELTIGGRPDPKHPIPGRYGECITHASYSSPLASLPPKMVIR